MLKAEEEKEWEETDEANNTAGVLCCNRCPEKDTNMRFQEKNSAWMYSWFHELNFYFAQQ